MTDSYGRFGENGFLLMGVLGGLLSPQLPLLVSIRFQILFHSPPGVLFTFPSRYYSLSVTG